MRKPRTGDKYPTWFSGQPDGLSTIIRIEPYKGRFTQFFQHTLILSAPKTYSGELPMAISAKDLDLFTVRHQRATHKT